MTMVTAEEMEARCKSAGFGKGDRDAYGLFMPDRLAIYLQKPDRALKPSIVKQTFWHEFAHALLWVLNDKRQADEKHIDQLGHYLHQAVTSFKFS